LSTKCPHWLNSPCPEGHTKNFEKAQIFCLKRRGQIPPLTCPKNVRTGQTPFSPDCGRFLWTAPTGLYHTYKQTFTDELQDRIQDELLLPTGKLRMTFSVIALSSHSKKL